MEKKGEKKQPIIAIEQYAISFWENMNLAEEDFKYSSKLIDEGALKDECDENIRFIMEAIR